MVANDQEKIKIAREYLMRADQGRPDVLELFHEDAEIYFLEQRDRPDGEHEPENSNTSSLARP